MKKITIMDVAARANVSKSTISAVINGKSTVNAETREHVLAVMRELNYRPKGMARTLKNGKEKVSCIGMIVRQSANPFYTGITSGAREYASQHGYLVIIATSEGDHAYEQKITNLFLSKDIKGAIIAPILEGAIEFSHLYNLKMLNFPFVLLEEIKGIQANVVSINNIESTRRTVRYLVDNGHTQIILFSGPEYDAHTHERIEGFQQAFMETSLALNKQMIIPTGSNFEDGYNRGLEYFKNRTKDQYPTAIICYNDMVALGLIAALDEMKIKVPDEVSVIGHDDIPFAGHYSTPLTTTRVPGFEIGKKAAEILIKNIESPKLLPVEKAVFDSELIIRNSTRIIK